jgi:hypothetical protein
MEPGTFLGETWRIGLTVILDVLLLWFWYIVASRMGSF